MIELKKNQVWTTEDGCVEVIITGVSGATVEYEMHDVASYAVSARQFSDTFTRLALADADDPSS